jgi:hypothetical protein
MSKFKVHVHKRKQSAENTFMLAEEIFEHETYALAEQFANAADGMLVKIYDEEGQILLSLVHEMSSIVSDYV